MSIGEKLCSDLSDFLSGCVDGIELGFPGERVGTIMLEGGHSIAGVKSIDLMKSGIAFTTTMETGTRYAHAFDPARVVAVSYT